MHCPGRCKTLSIVAVLRYMLESMVTSKIHLGQETLPIVQYLHTMTSDTYPHPWLPTFQHPHAWAISMYSHVIDHATHHLWAPGLSVSRPSSMVLEKAARPARWAPPRRSCRLANDYSTTVAQSHAQCVCGEYLRMPRVP